MKILTLRISLLCMLLIVCQSVDSRIFELTTTGPKIRVVGTGQTTGHIADLTVTNDSDEPMVINPEIFYIPSDGKYQSYVGRIPQGITIEPRGTVTIPVEGYCTDVHKPPVPSGESMPPTDTWLPVRHIEPPDPLNPIGTMPRSIFPQSPVEPFTPGAIPGITGSPAYKPSLDPEADIIVTWPGSDRPIGGTYDPSADPHNYAPLVVRILEQIEGAVDQIREDPDLTTPFANDPVREREAIIQQTFWICSSALTGDKYEQEDFMERVYDQFETSSGRTVAALPPEQKEELDTGVDAFWESFMATGVEAKVISDSSPGAERIRNPRSEETVPGSVAESSRRCIDYGNTPEIDPRTGFDIVGELYRQGKIPSDYLNDMRYGQVQRKVNSIRAMHHSLGNVLNGELNKIPCTNDNAHREGPQTFPDFPWEDFFLTVDFCADNSGKDNLADFLDPNADPDALSEWLIAYERSIENLGLWNPNETPYMAGYESTIDRALEGIADANARFQDQMYTAMELRFNRSRAEGRLWSAVATIAAAAVSAGIGAAIGGATAAIASAMISTTGFVWDQGLQALGADPAAAAIVSSLITLSMGVSSAWGTGVVQLIGEEIVTGLPAQMIEAGAAAGAQEDTQAFVSAMAMLDDNIWDALMKELSEDYEEASIARFNEIRDEMQAEVARHVQRLCAVYNSLDALLPALLEAHEQAKEYLHSSYWRDLWNDAMDKWFDCCCEWSDGSGPTGSCVVSIPEFGYDPGNK